MSAETKGKTQVFHFGYAECGLTCAVSRKLVQMSAETKGKTQVFHLGYAECGLTCALRRKLVQDERRGKKNLFFDIPEPIGFASITSTRRKQKTGVIYAIPPHFPIPKSLPFSQSPNHAFVKA